jgi:hypothetical protein
VAATPKAAPQRRQGQPAAERLVRHIVSGWRCQALHAAVQLLLPEALRDGPRSAEDLAIELACDADGLARLLRALCTLGVARERRDGRFALTASGRLLCPPAAPGEPSLRALAQWWGGPLWPMWGELAYSVRTGRSAREKLTGESGYRYLDQGGALPLLFHHAQAALTALVLDDIARWPGWPRARTLVDVGGGHAQVALAMLSAHRGLRATVLDLPHAEAGARQRITQAGLSARCAFQGGSFLDPLPAGADVYLLKSILHNWDDETCARILQRCADAVPRHGTLLIIERVQPSRSRPRRRDEAAARTDLNMLAGLGGRERTSAQFAALLAPVGFRVAATQETGFEFSVIEARRGS